MPMTTNGLEIGTGILLGANLRNPPPFERPDRAKLYREVWVSLFDDCEDAEFVAACKAYVTSPGEFSALWPVPAALRALIPRLETARQIATRDTGEDAWLDVVRQVGQVGPYQTPSFDFRQTAAVRALGGWYSLCETLGNENRTWMRKDFLAAYHAASEREALAIPETKARGLLVDLGMSRRRIS